MVVGRRDAKRQVAATARRDRKAVAPVAVGRRREVRLAVLENTGTAGHREIDLRAFDDVRTVIRHHDDERERQRLPTLWAS